MRAWVLALVWLTGCGTTRMRLEVVRPPALVVPDSIERISVLNRAGNSTGAAAADALQQALNESTRFTNRPVLAALAPRQGPLTQTEVQGVCDSTGAEGLISLEAIHAQDSRRVRAVENQPYGAGPGQVRPTTTWSVEREVDLQVHWRFYDPRREQPFDDYNHRQPRMRITARGPNPLDAERRVGTPEQAHTKAATQAGKDYAARIIATVELVERRLHLGGSPELRQGVRQARIGDWPGAEAAWNTATADGSPRVRAAAWKNLAVAAEVAGRFGQAVAHLDRALTLEEDPELRRYRSELAQRSSALRRQRTRPAEVTDQPLQPELPLALPASKAPAETPLTPP